jgi:hypothetical protein
MIPKEPAPGHSRPKDGVASLAYDPGVGTGFRERSCSNKKLERDDDSKKSHPALGLGRRYRYRTGAKYSLLTLAAP